MFYYIALRTWRNDIIDRLLSCFDRSLVLLCYDFKVVSPFKMHFLSFHLGDAVTYTHWLPDRKNNHGGHRVEDCVEFIPYRNKGAWDDLPCDDRWERPFICQNSKTTTIISCYLWRRTDLYLMKKDMKHFSA